MGDVWYTADLHFGHENVIKHCDRPWLTADEMNEGLIQRWNQVVKVWDTVYVLGDVSLSTKHLHHVSRLRGRKVLIAGNHDACWSGHSRKARATKAVQDYYDAGFSSVVPSGFDTFHFLGDMNVVLSHLPYQGDHTTEDRYVDQRPINRGLPLICGHVHTAWLTSGNQLNVGVDVWNYQPVHVDDVVELVKELPSHLP